jgi:hypothetical protein
MTCSTRRRLTAAILLVATLALPVAVAPAGAAPTVAHRLAVPPPGLPALKADYRFGGTLASSAGGAPALVNVGPGVNTFATENVDGVDRTVLQFPEGNGVQLNNATPRIPRDRYTIRLSVRLATTSAYQRLINYGQPAPKQDHGIYIVGGGFAVYPNDMGPPDVIGANEWVDLILTRSAGGRLRGYLDGVPQFDLAAMYPNEARLTAENVLRFFRDNANRDESAGAVSRIRLYADQMTPAQVAAVTG